MQEASDTWQKALKSSQPQFVEFHAEAVAEMLGNAEMSVSGLGHCQRNTPLVQCS